MASMASSIASCWFPYIDLDQDSNCSVMARVIQLGGWCRHELCQRFGVCIDVLGCSNGKGALLSAIVNAHCFGI